MTSPLNCQDLFWSLRLHLFENPICDQFTRSLVLYTPHIRFSRYYDGSSRHSVRNVFCFTVPCVSHPPPLAAAHAIKTTKTPRNRNPVPRGYHRSRCPNRPSPTNPSPDLSPAQFVLSNLSIRHRIDKRRCNELFHIILYASWLVKVNNTPNRINRISLYKKKNAANRFRSAALTLTS